MIACNSIIFNSNGVEHEVLISPLMLHLKKMPLLNFDKIEKLFFYENWRDEEYLANLEKEHLQDEYKIDSNIIKYGQDFKKFYLGYLNVNFETKTCWGWQGESKNFSEQDVKVLSESLFSPTAKTRQITIFSPTRPSDFNLKKSKYD